MICKICKKEFNKEDSEYSNYCGNTCYWKMYYEKNKKEILERRKEWHKKHYVSQRLNKQKKTEEEIKEYMRTYYQEHKEYFKQKNREYYLSHKNDPKYKKRHKEALRKYLKKRRLKKRYENVL